MIGFIKKEGNIFMGNKNLNKAQQSKNDEFYTQYKDVERELRHYHHHFCNKTVYCNTDNYRKSNFVKYFVDNFHRIGLKKIISLDIDGYYFEYDGKNKKYSKLENGDFRSEHSTEILKNVDIVCTNPPFSLFREYILQLISYNKKFLVIGNINALTYKEIFPLIREDEMWLGYNSTRFFLQPDGSIFETARTYWYTNLNIKKRHKEFILHKKYNPEEYPEYDNYHAINIDKAVEIPRDYKGAMGVPITFIDKYNPDQFEILDANNYRKSEDVPYKDHGLIKDKESTINGKAKYVRVLIKNKR